MNAGIREQARRKGPRASAGDGGRDGGGRGGGRRLLMTGQALGEPGRGELSRRTANVGAMLND